MNSREHVVRERLIAYGVQAGLTEGEIQDLLQDEGAPPPTQQRREVTRLKRTDGMLGRVEGAPMRTLLTRFRVKADPTRPQYYVVRVSPTKAAMYADYQRVKVVDDDASDLCDFEAIMMPWQRFMIGRDGTETEHPERGAILFCEQSIWTETVSHEMTHAAVDYLETVEGVDWNHLKADHALEERLCRVQGYLVGEFWWKWQAYQRRWARQT